MRCSRWGTGYGLSQVGTAVRLLLVEMGWRMGLGRLRKARDTQRPWFDGRVSGRGYHSTSGRSPGLKLTPSDVWYVIRLNRAPLAIS